MWTNTVSTKPVRHRFGKVSTEEVRQGSWGRRAGLGFREGLPSLVELRHVGSEESASLLRGDFTTPPEAGAGELEVKCVLSPQRREGKARSVAHPHEGDQSSSILKDTNSPSPSKRRGVCRTEKMTIKNEN
jgi:hypothetical protein